MWILVRENWLRIAISIVSGVLLAGTVSVASWVAVSGGPTRAPKEIEVTIPPGTAARIAAGETSSPIPRTLDLIRGDTLVVHNEDSVGHRFGATVVPAGQTVSVREQEASTNSFVCSFHPSGSLGLTVQNPNNPLWVLLPTFMLGTPFGIVIAIVSVVFSKLDTGSDPQAAAPV